MHWRHKKFEFAALLATLTLLTSASHSHDDTARSDRTELREERRVRDNERRQRDASRAQREQRERDLKEQKEKEKHRDADSRNSGSSGREQSGSDDSDDSGDNSELDQRARANAVRVELDVDVEGRERRRDEVLMVGRAEAVVAVRDAGFSIANERVLTAFAETLARIRVRQGLSVEQTIAQLQAVAPEASFAPHHVFRASHGDTDSAAVSASATIPTGVRVGVIDTGADTSWSALARAVIQTEGFADGGYTPRTHGTRVAEIVASRGAQLVIGDVFGVDADNRLVASAEAIAAAIHWLVASKVRVINVSIEGPDNLVLAHVIRRAIAADTLIVAAAGNGGPAAKPAYPAAYPGVIAVTAIDEHGSVYRRANHGDYIAFAARGVHIATEYGTTTTKNVSGTSYAAPIVAVAVATKLRNMPMSKTQDVIVALQRAARDLGVPGRDPIYGWGRIDSAD